MLKIQNIEYLECFVDRCIISTTLSISIITLCRYIMCYEGQKAFSRQTAFIHM